MLEVLKIEVYKALIKLNEEGLALLEWGSVSARDEQTGNIVMKSGEVAQKELIPRDMYVVDVNGTLIEGDEAPPADLYAHLELYRAYPQICSIIHTHSQWATVFAQAGRSIPVLGATHTDKFCNDIAITSNLAPQESEEEFDKNIGRAIINILNEEGSPLSTPGVLVKGHGPFVFGKDVSSAVANAIALEFIAKMAYHTLSLCTDTKTSEILLDVEEVYK